MAREKWVSRLLAAPAARRGPTFGRISAGDGLEMSGVTLLFCGHGWPSVSWGASLSDPRADEGREAATASSRIGAPKLELQTYVIYCAHGANPTSPSPTLPIRPRVIIVFFRPALAPMPADASFQATKVGVSTVCPACPRPVTPNVVRIRQPCLFPPPRPYSGGMQNHRTVGTLRNKRTQCR